MDKFPLARNAAVVTLVVLALLALAILLWQIKQVFLIVFGAALIAIFFRAVAEGISDFTRLPYGWSLAVGFSALVLLVAGGIYISGAPIGDQMTKLSDEIPRSLEKIGESIRQYSWGESLLNQMPDSAKDLPVTGKEATSFAADILTSLTGGLGMAILIMFLSLYFAASPSTYSDGVIRLFPPSKRPRIREVLHESHVTLKWWILGIMVSMAFVGILTTIGLSLLGIPLPFALGAIAAVLTFIPNIGPVVSAVPAMLLAFVQSPMWAVYVGILYLAIQTVESYLITPLIQKRAVSLPPALTILAQVGMGLLFGIPGIVLASPMTAMAIVVVTKLYIEDTLEQNR